MKWTNSLKDGQVSITPENFQRATKVFRKFGFENLGSYNDFYLSTDTLLPERVVVEFRNVIYSTYGLDSAHYYTCSHLSSDVSKKLLKQEWNCSQTVVIQGWMRA